MPAKTSKLRRAMYAAAAGKSKIGIPKAVGKRFVKHERSSNRTAAARKGKK